MRGHHSAFAGVSLACALVGCEARTPSPPAKSPLEFQTTQEIAPKSDAPGGAPSSAAGQVQAAAFEQASRIIVGKAVEQFRALEGRYPNDHAEFMEKVIRANEIRLPELPPDKQYQYDAGAHELKVVDRK